MTQHPDFHSYLSKKRRKNILDWVVIFAAIGYPLSATPQALLVFQGHTQGVSLTSWAFFVVFSSLFFTYGLVHKVRPMIIGNGLWVVVNSSVVVGILIHRIGS